MGMDLNFLTSLLVSWKYCLKLISLKLIYENIKSLLIFLHSFVVGAFHVQEKKVFSFNFSKLLIKKLS